MKYGDFSSLVQLGVGLHAGTALLQLYGEIGIQPITRTLTRIRKLVDEREQTQEALAEELAHVETDFDIFRIQLFNTFKKYVLINSLVAMLLIFVLITISYMAAEILPDGLSVFFVALSVLPAPITLGVLWFDASKQLRPLKTRADRLERTALGTGGPPA